jgi:hypothetical protein
MKKYMLLSKLVMQVVESIDSSIPEYTILIQTWFISHHI